METVYADPWLCVNGYELTGDTTELTITVGQETKDVVTALAVGTSGNAPLRRRLVGVEEISLAYGVIWDATHTHAQQISTHGAAASIIAGRPRAVGDPAWILSGIQAAYINGGKVGEVGEAGGLAAAGAGLFAAGKTSAYQTISATGDTGLPFQLPAVVAGRSLVLGLQVVAKTGTPSFVVLHRTSTSSGGTYTTRYTSPALSTAPFALPPIVIAGPITDTWHKTTWTLTGTGTLVLRVVAGVR